MIKCINQSIFINRSVSRIEYSTKGALPSSEKGQPWFCCTSQTTAVANERLMHVACAKVQLHSKFQCQNRPRRRTPRNHAAISWNSGTPPSVSSPLLSLLLTGTKTSSSAGALSVDGRAARLKTYPRWIHIQFRRIQIFLLFYSYSFDIVFEDKPLTVLTA